MPTSIHANTPTVEQLRQLDQDIAVIDQKLQSISALVRGWYGKNSQAAIRADEVGGALQRLKWVLERGQKVRMAGR